MIDTKVPFDTKEAKVKWQPMDVKIRLCEAPVCLLTILIFNCSSTLYQQHLCKHFSKTVFLLHADIHQHRLGGTQ